MSTQIDKNKKKSKSRLVIIIVAGLLLLIGLLVFLFSRVFFAIPFMYSQESDSEYILSFFLQPIKVEEVRAVYITDYTALDRGEEVKTSFSFIEVPLERCLIPGHARCLVYKNWDSSFYPLSKAYRNREEKIDSGTKSIQFAAPSADPDDEFDILIIINGVLVAYLDDVNSNNGTDMIAFKPVIYLYPEETEDVNVDLKLDGYITSSYPPYNDGWTVTAEPDGTLTDDSERMYNYLFWEGVFLHPDFDYNHYFCVPGDATMEFLEDYLRCAGLTDKEAGDFISYWLPKMESNKYNLIYFQTDEYEKEAKLSVSPSPDTIIRVYMVFEGSEDYKESTAVMPETPERIGFTVVEWGGSEKGS